MSSSAGFAHIQSFFYEKCQKRNCSDLMFNNSDLTLLS